MTEFFQIELNKNSLGFFLLDKVVFALLLVLAGVIAKYVLERVRTRLALKSELAKQRVVHIGEVWSRLYESEAATRELLRAASRVIDEHGNDEAALRNLLPLQEESRTRAGVAQQMADANRFWLGETLYNSMRSFHNVQMQLIPDFTNHNQAAALEQSEARLNEARMSIVNFIENPL